MGPHVVARGRHGTILGQPRQNGGHRKKGFDLTSDIDVVTDRGVVSDVIEQPDGGHLHDEGRTAIAKEGQRNTRHRPKTHHRCDVDQSLQNDPGGEANRNESQLIVPTRLNDSRRETEKGREEDDDNKRSDETEFLAND